jgi:glycosyltransferase involved in cell wall biosynthesis
VLTEHYDCDLENAGLVLPYCTGLWLYESATNPAQEPPGDVPERLWTYRSEDFDTALRQQLRDPRLDLIHVEGYFLVDHLPTDCTLPLVVVEENIEYVLDREREAAGRSRGASWTTSRTLEHRVWSAATLVASVSEQDAAVIRRDAPKAVVTVVPNGFDHLPQVDARMHHGVGSEIVFLGNYGWAPTRDGAWDLITTIWPRIRQAMPQARLSLVGAGLPNDLAVAAAAAGADVVGQVDEVLPVLAAADIFVCPVTSGYGSKVKMMEAMRAGCAIVSTSAGLRGLPRHARFAVMVADGNNKFADTVVELLHSPNRRSELSRLATDCVRTLPTWDEAARLLTKAWLHAVAAGSNGGTGRHDRV